VLCDLAVTSLAQCGDRVQRAVAQKLQPEFAFNVVRDSAWNTGANEKICQVRCSFGGRSDDQITTREMFHATGFGHRHRDVNDRWYGNDVGSSANLIGIVDAVLQTNYRRIWPNELSDLCCGRSGIVRFDAKQNQRAISDRADVGCRPGPDSILTF